MNPLILAGIVLLSELHQGSSVDNDIRNIPSKVPSTESVAGLRVEPPSGGAESVEVHADALPGGALGCVSRVGVDPMSNSLLLYPPERVVPVRIERLVEHDDTAALSVEYVFVDRRTHAAKSLRTETIELKSVASYLAGERASETRHVYAYRNDRVVHVVWATPENCGHSHLRVDTTDPNGPKSSVLAPSWTPTSSTKTRHMRVSASLSQSTQDPDPLLSIAVAVR